MLREKYKLFIFDLDGTLIDSQIDILKSVNHVRFLKSLPPLSLDTVRSYIGNGANVLIEKIFPGASREELKDAFAEFKKYYSEHSVENTKIYPEIPLILEKLKNKKKAVLTNKPESISRIILDSLGIAEKFSIIWGGDTGAHRKPAPEPVHKILEKLNIKPSDAVLIGDGINDIKAAKSSGLKIVALGYGYSDNDELKNLMPDYFVNTPRELLELI